MKKFKNFLKNNKYMVIVVSLCLLLTIFVFVIKFVFFPNEGTAIYGDRLDGIEEVEITNDQLGKIEDSVKEKEEVEEVSASVTGRILNVMVTVKDDVSVDAAKTVTDKVDEALEEDQRTFYDIQVFISKNTDDATFPIIGYHHQNSDHYSWTKNR